MLPVTRGRANLPPSPTPPGTVGESATAGLFTTSPTYDRVSRLPGNEEAIDGRPPPTTPMQRSSAACHDSAWAVGGSRSISRAWLRACGRNSMCSCSRVVERPAVQTPPTVQGRAVGRRETPGLAYWQHYCGRIVMGFVAPRAVVGRPAVSRTPSPDGAGALRLPQRTAQLLLERGEARGPSAARIRPWDGGCRAARVL